MKRGAVPDGLGLGCWEFGGMGISDPDVAASVAMIRKAYELGIRHFDTAQGYGDGSSERILGRALNDRRDEVVYATKAHAMRREGVSPTIEASCERIGTDYIDLFYIHWPKSGLDLRPMMEGLEEERRRGRIRFVGVSNFSVANMEQASEAGRIDYHQLCYNLLWRYPERDILPYCRRHGIRVVTFSSIAQGLLSDKKRGPDTFEPGDERARTLYYRSDVWPGLEPYVERLQKLARETATPLSSLALQWVLGRDEVSSALVGVRSAEQIAANVQAAAQRLRPETAGALTRLSDEAMRAIPDEGNIFLYYP